MTTTKQLMYNNGERRKFPYSHSTIDIHSFNFKVITMWWAYIATNVYYNVHKIVVTKWQCNSILQCVFIAPMIAKELPQKWTKFIIMDWWNAMSTWHCNCSCIVVTLQLYKSYFCELQGSCMCCIHIWWIEFVTIFATCPIALMA